MGFRNCLLLFRFVLSSLCPRPVATSIDAQERDCIYKFLFKEGVMVSKKDVHMPQTPGASRQERTDLHATEAMPSLKSRGYTKEQFAWKHFY
ncbi:40S ribosomal protein S10 [Cricetulus griseus]|uniref:40S ribosomal protein S10 n=1 Tax=Cricetulus griseus TaxID=10029 RepID=G3HCB9_CRIGR|nr:40S ribosomal protein S10 [Cricetulus griseus]